MSSRKAAKLRLRSVGLRVRMCIGLDIGRWTVQWRFLRWWRRPRRARGSRASPRRRAATRLVALRSRIDRDAEHFHTRAHGLTHFRHGFANRVGEDHSVRRTHQRQVRAQVFFESPQVDLRGEVARLASGLPATDSRASRMSADVPERPSTPLRWLSCFSTAALSPSASASKPQRDARIEIAAAGAHDQPLQRRVAHRVVDGLPVDDGTQTGAAAAQVAAHGAESIERDAHQPCSLGHDILVADAVVAVLANSHVAADVRGESRRCGRAAGSCDERPCPKSRPAAGRERRRGRL